MRVQSALMNVAATSGLLRYLAERLGREQLAARLKVTVGLLELWLSGEISVPARKLLLLADLVEDLQARDGGQNVRA